MMKKKMIIKHLRFPTYLSVIKNSVGSKMFRHSYADVDGKKTDITKNGHLSCTFYVSSILKMFGLIKEVHTTVKGGINDLEESGWIKIKKPRTGCVLLWEPKKFDENRTHMHLGFYLGKGKAISNDEKVHVPKVSHWTNGKDKEGKPTREVMAIYWHKNLEN